MQPYPRAFFYRKIVTAKHFIDRHYAEPIEVNQIAREAGFSRYDFVRQFRKTYGTTPRKYLIRVRLERAAELLQSTDIPVQQVCFEVGYSSVASFSNLFRRYYTVSPSAYRRHRSNAMRENRPALKRSFPDALFTIVSQSRSTRVWGLETVPGPTLR